MLLTNWGNYPSVETTLRSPSSVKTMQDEVCAAPSLVARGMGRCYGDSACNDELVLSTMRLDKMLSFDAGTGLLVTEAGVSLADIVEAFAPRGWFMPVTPGTKLVTLGGAVASDVHGKNHHVAGTIGQHVCWLDVLTATQGIVRCSAQHHTDLFNATCGGHGLTGIIVRVALQLVRIPSTWISQTTVKAANLHEIMDAFDSYGHFPYSVAWIDCLQQGRSMGRSVLMCGDFASPEHLGEKQRARLFDPERKKQLTVPFNFPSLALNTLSVRAFNALYYGKAPRGVTENIVSYNTFFYPLDSINCWNRIYGKRGFTQYQFVLPRQSATEGLPRILERIARSGQGSFLAVLKLFGAQNHRPGNISFPMEGYTLALDFPITSGLFPLLNELDAMVLDFGGRHYLTKDARMEPLTLRKGYGSQLDSFCEVKARWDPQNKFISSQGKRLGLGQAGPAYCRDSP